MTGVLQNLPILSLVTFLPLVGALVILILARDEDAEVVASQARWVALWASLVTFLL